MLKDLLNLRRQLSNLERGHEALKEVLMSKCEIDFDMIDEEDVIRTANDLSAKE